MPSTSTLEFNNLPAAQTTSIGDAFREVAVAVNHLASAVVHAAFAPITAPSEPLTAVEEAEALRTYAADIQNQDPDFALDLFAAADRHEIEAVSGPKTSTGAV